MKNGRQQHASCRNDWPFSAANEVRPGQTYSAHALLTMPAVCDKRAKKWQISEFGVQRQAPIFMGTQNPIHILFPWPIITGESAQIFQCNARDYLTTYGLGFSGFLHLFHNLSQFGYVKVVLCLCVFLCFWEFVSTNGTDCLESDLCVEWNVHAHSLPAVECLIHTMKLGKFVLIL